MATENPDSPRQRIAKKLFGAGFHSLGRILLKGGARIAGAAVKNTPVGGILDEIGVLDGIGDALGIESREEKEIAKEIEGKSPEELQALIRLKELDADAELALIELEKAREAEITARHAADMLSDSPLSKNIRPITLIVLLKSSIEYSFTVLWGVVFLTIAVSKGIEIDIPPIASQVILWIGGALWTATGGATGFYFNQRTKEKSSAFESAARIVESKIFKGGQS